MQDNRDSMTALQEQNAGATMGSNAGGSGNETNPFTSGQYIFSGIIELAIRRSIEDAPKQGISPIRLAILAAQVHGRNWFSVSDMTMRLAGVGKEVPSRECAQRMERLGLTETRRQGIGGKQVYQARIRADVMLFDANHIHGQTALRLIDGIETFYASRPNASGLAALLLIGIHVTRLTNSTDLRKFCEPQHSYGYPSSLTSKILGKFIDEGMVATIRPQGLTKGAFEVVAVGFSS